MDEVIELLLECNVEEQSLKLPTIGRSRPVADLFCEAQVWHAVGSDAVVIRCLRANLPAATQRLVDADNGKPLVGASDCQRTHQDSFSNAPQTQYKRKGDSKIA
jgi:hypothetical protein